MKLIIESNTDWKLSSSEDWISLSDSEGSGRIETDMNEALNRQINIYPNPAGKVLNIEFGLTEREVDIHLFTIDGKLIHQQSFYHVPNAEMNLDDLKKGIYIVKVLLDSTTVTKIILLD